MEQVTELQSLTSVCLYWWDLLFFPVPSCIYMSQLYLSLGGVKPKQILYGVEEMLTQLSFYMPGEFFLSGKSQFGAK